MTGDAVAARTVDEAGAIASVVNDVVMVGAVVEEEMEEFVGTASFVVLMVGVVAVTQLTLAAVLLGFAHWLVLLLLFPSSPPGLSGLSGSLPSGLSPFPVSFGLGCSGASGVSGSSGCLGSVGVSGSVGCLGFVAGVGALTAGGGTPSS